METLMNAVADETLLVEYARDRDEGALATLLDRHWARAYRLALGVLGDPGAAEDAAQEAFVALARSAKRFDGERRFLPWLRTLVLNAARTSARSRRRRVRHEEHAATLRAVEQEPQDASVEEVRARLAALPEDESAPIVLHYFESRSFDEIALELGCPRGTASSRVRRGLERLRESLAGAGCVVAAADVERVVEDCARVARGAGAPPAPPAARVAKMAAGLAFATLARTAVAVAVAGLVTAIAWSVVATGPGPTRTGAAARGTAGPDRGGETIGPVATRAATGSEVAVAEVAVAERGNAGAERSPAKAASASGQREVAGGATPRPSLAVAGRVRGPGIGRPDGTVVGLFGVGAAAPLRVAEVAADGSWRVEGLAPGWFGEVRAWAPNFNVARGYVALDAADIVVPDVVVGSGSKLVGRVVTAGGQPIAGAPVVLLDESGVAAAGLASPDGRFRIEGLASGALLLVLAERPFATSPVGFARRADVAGAPLRRTVSIPETGELDLGDVAVVAARARISGHVFGPGGRPEGGALVSLRWLEVERSARTGPDGAFAFGELAAGSYELTATREGLVAVAPTAVTLAALDATTVDLTLTSGGSITGSVAGPPSRLANLMVRGTPERGAPVVAPVGSDGRFSLTGLARGTWRVRLEPTLLDDLTVAVTPDRETAVSFPEPSGVGRVHVSVAGAAAGFSAGAFAGPMTRLHQDGRRFGEARGAEGRATLENVPAGEIGVAVSCGRDTGGLLVLFREGVRLREGEDARVSFELPERAATGAIAGRVEKMGPTGQVIVTAWGDGLFSVVPARTDSTFKLEGLPEGRYRLVALHLRSGASRELSGLDVKRGETTTAVIEAPSTDRR